MKQFEHIAQISDIGQLRAIRRDIEQQLESAENRLRIRRKMFAERCAPTYILASMLARTEKIITMFAFARRVYAIIHSILLRTKKG